MTSICIWSAYMHSSRGPPIVPEPRSRVNKHSVFLHLKLDNLKLPKSRLKVNKLWYCFFLNMKKAVKSSVNKCLAHLEAHLVGVMKVVDKHLKFTRNSVRTHGFMVIAYGVLY